MGLTMQLGRFSDFNLATLATASGGTWSTAFPLANLLTEEKYVAAPARCLMPASLAASQFQLIWTEPQIISLVSLFFHTLSLGSKYRLTATTLDDAAFAAPLVQTGWEWVYPSLYDPEDLDGLAENAISGTLLASEIALVKQHLFAPIDEVLAQRLRVELDDQANPAGFVDIGGVHVAAGFSPAINFERARDLRVKARDLVDEAPSGRRFAERRDPMRIYTTRYAQLSDPEARRFVDAALRVRTTGTVLFTPDVDDPASLMREAFPANFDADLPGASLSWPGQGGVTLVLKEILA